MPFEVDAERLGGDRVHGKPLAVAHAEVDWADRLVRHDLGFSVGAGAEGDRLRRSPAIPGQDVAKHEPRSDPAATMMGRRHSLRTSPFTRAQDLFGHVDRRTREVVEQHAPEMDFGRGHFEWLLMYRRSIRDRRASGHRPCTSIRPFLTTTVLPPKSGIEMASRR